MSSWQVAAERSRSVLRGIYAVARSLLDKRRTVPLLLWNDSLLSENLITSLRDPRTLLGYFLLASNVSCVQCSSIFTDRVQKH